MVDADIPQDNEDVNLDIAHALYTIAKQLDPSRPVNTADGIWYDGSFSCLFVTKSRILAGALES